MGMVTFLFHLGVFKKPWIDISVSEKLRLGFYCMKAYTEYDSFLNNGCDIFMDWMTTAKNAKIW